jgi:hypothetical protein
MTVITQLRRCINEPTESTYSDVELSGYLVSASNDINAVASEIWFEKAAALSVEYNYATEGES